MSALECGNCYYDGDGVAKDLEEAYVWYKVAQLAGDNRVGGLVDSIGGRPEISVVTAAAPQIYKRVVMSV
jgi:TPR repeat protein